MMFIWPWNLIDGFGLSVCNNSETGYLIRALFLGRQLDSGQLCSPSIAAIELTAPS